MLFCELLKLPYDLREGRFCQLCVMTCSLAVEREVAKFREAATHASVGVHCKTCYIYTWYRVFQVPMLLKMSLCYKDSSSYKFDLYYKDNAGSAVCGVVPLVLVHIVCCGLLDYIVITSLSPRDHGRVDPKYI